MAAAVATLSAAVAAAVAAAAAAAAAADATASLRGAAAAASGSGALTRVRAKVQLLQNCNESLSLLFRCVESAADAPRDAPGAVPARRTTPSRRLADTRGQR
eukprot:scaffold29664_cov42-Phaeocystis_antarctica.AAC.1